MEEGTTSPKVALPPPRKKMLYLCNNGSKRYIMAMTIEAHHGYVRRVESNGSRYFDVVYCWGCRGWALKAGQGMMFGECRHIMTHTNFGFFRRVLCGHQRHRVPGKVALSSLYRIHCERDRLAFVHPVRQFNQVFLLDGTG